MSLTYQHRVLLLYISYAANASSALSTNTLFPFIKEVGIDIMSSAFIFLSLFKVVWLNYYLLTVSFYHAVKIHVTPNNIKELFFCGFFSKTPFIKSMLCYFILIFHHNNVFFFISKHSTNKHAYFLKCLKCIEYFVELVVT